MPVYNRLFAALLLLAGSLIYTNPAPAANALPEDRSKAVILAYTRIGEDDKPDESLTEEQFIAHIREIKTGGYHVLPLPDILDHLENNRPLPPLTLAITLDGAYRSAMQNAVPHLLAENLPFTVFYAADPLDQHDSDYASWQDLKSLKNTKTLHSPPSRPATATSPTPRAQKCSPPLIKPASATVKNSPQKAPTSPIHSANTRSN